MELIEIRTENISLQMYHILNISNPLENAMVALIVCFIVHAGKDF